MVLVRVGEGLADAPKARGRCVARRTKRVARVYELHADRQNAAPLEVFEAETVVAHEECYSSASEELFVRCCILREQQMRRSTVHPRVSFADA